MGLSPPCFLLTRPAVCHWEGRRRETGARQGNDNMAHLMPPPDRDETRGTTLEGTRPDPTRNRIANMSSYPQHLLRLPAVLYVLSVHYMFHYRCWNRSCGIPKDSFMTMAMRRKPDAPNTHNTWDRKTSLYSAVSVTKGVEDDDTESTGSEDISCDRP